MKLIFISFIFSVSIVDWSISQDVERQCPTTTCHDSETRKQIIHLKPYCQCDDQCGNYDDCCMDAPNKTRTIRGSAYVCQPLAGDAYFVLRICAGGTAKNREKCAMSANYTDHVQQMKIKIPVTSKSSGITYGNVFCALCNNVSDFTFWELSVRCGTFRTTVNITDRGPSSFLANRPELKDKLLVFRNATNRWQYANGSAAPVDCTMRPKVPVTLLRSVRPCFAGLKSVCPSTWTVPNITRKCVEYQSVVHQKVGDGDFRNAYCALCNGVPLQNLSCFLPGGLIKIGALPVYSVLQSLARTPATTTEAPAERRPTNERTYLYVSARADCVNLLERIDLTKIKAETVVYRTMRRTYVRNTTTINGTDVQICTIGNTTLNEFAQTHRNTAFFRYVVNIGCLCAGTLLLLHAWYFCAAEQPKRLHRKLMVSYAAAMLLGNAGFLYESVSGDDSSDRLIVCAVGGTLAYYGFLASILWISSMAFDISRSVWAFAFDRSASQGQASPSGLFVGYSAICWSVPAVVTLIRIVCGHPGNVGPADQCLPQNDVTLLWFFVFPLTVSMSVNMAFYLCTVYVVFAENGVVDAMLKAGVDLKLHTCLIVTTNFMWLTIVLAEYLGNRSLIMLFTVSDVFLASIVFRSSTDQNGAKSRSAYENVYTVTAAESAQK